MIWPLSSSRSPLTSSNHITSIATILNYLQFSNPESSFVIKLYKALRTQDWVAYKTIWYSKWRLLFPTNEGFWSMQKNRTGSFSQSWNGDRCHRHRFINIKVGGRLQRVTWGWRPEQRKNVRNTWGENSTCYITWRFLKSKWLQMLKHEWR